MPENTRTTRELIVEMPYSAHVLTPVKFRHADEALEDIEQTGRLSWIDVQTADTFSKPVPIEEADAFIIQGATPEQGNGDPDHLALSNAAALESLDGDGEVGAAPIVTHLDETYGAALFRIGDAWSGSALAILADAVPSPLLWSAVEGLGDYPIVDESDYSEREWNAFEADLAEAVEDARTQVLERAIGDRVERVYVGDSDSPADCAAITGLLYAKVGKEGPDAYGLYGGEGYHAADWGAVADLYRACRDEYFDARARDALYIGEAAQISGQGVLSEGAGESDAGGAA